MDAILIVKLRKVINVQEEQLISLIPALTYVEMELIHLESKATVMMETHITMMDVVVHVKLKKDGLAEAVLNTVKTLAQKYVEMVLILDFMSVMMEIL